MTSQQSEIQGLSASDVAMLARYDLTTFIECAFREINPHTTFFLAHHIELIAAKLEDVRSGRCKRLIINLPPRHLKSICVTIAFVAWLLGHDPSKHVICASYGQELSNELASKCRRIMQSEFYRELFGNILSGRQALDDFETVASGRRLATSVGGVLTGRGADYIIVDDPQKADEALSETSRKALQLWFDNTLRSRLNDKANGAIIIVMQRLHQADLVGHVQASGERWDVLSLPAIAEVDEAYPIDGILGASTFIRSAGQALNPVRESLESLIETRRRVGTFTFSAQYQQNPIPLGGAIVKTEWLQYYDPSEVPKRFSSVIQSWDTANKTGELNDYSVCTTWGIHENRYYLLHVSRKRLNFPDLQREVLKLAGDFKPHKVLIEDKASGTQLIQILTGKHRFSIIPCLPPPGEDKQMRLFNQTVAFENGQVFLPRNAPWLGIYVSELVGFPGTEHADQVDSTTQALAFLGTYRRGVIITEGTLERLARSKPRWAL